MDSKESMLEIQNLHVVYKTDLETVYAQVKQLWRSP